MTENVASDASSGGGGDASVATDGLPDRIHDLASFNETTGEDHEVAGLYFYQQLDSLVDLAYKIACDFFKRPQLYIKLNGLSQVLAELHGRYGSNEILPSDTQRDAIFLPIFGSGGMRTLQAGVLPQPEAGDFPKLRDDLLKAAAAFSERAVDSGIDMLRARVRDAHRPMLEYLNGIEGDSIRWSRDNALPTLTEQTSYTILRSTGIGIVFGTPPPTTDFPYAEESAGQKLVENIWKQLAGTEHPSLNRDRISNLQRLALRGAEALAAILDFNENLGNADLNRLITRLYTWDAALWGVKASDTPQPAAEAQPPSVASPGLTGMVSPYMLGTRS